MKFLNNNQIDKSDIKRIIAIITNIDKFIFLIIEENNKAKTLMTIAWRVINVEQIDELRLRTLFRYSACNSSRILLFWSVIYYPHNNYYTLRAFSPFIDMILSHSTPNENNRTFKNRGSKLLQMAFCDNMDKM